MVPAPGCGVLGAATSAMVTRSAARSWSIVERERRRRYCASCGQQWPESYMHCRLCTRWIGDSLRVTKEYWMSPGRAEQTVQLEIWERLWAGLPTSFLGPLVQEATVTSILTIADAPDVPAGSGLERWLDRLPALIGDRGGILPDLLQASGLTALYVDPDPSEHAQRALDSAVEARRLAQSLGLAESSGPVRVHVAVNTGPLAVARPRPRAPVRSWLVRGGALRRARDLATEAPGGGVTVSWGTHLLVRRAYHGRGIEVTRSAGDTDDPAEVRRLGQWLPGGVVPHPPTAAEKLQLARRLEAAGDRVRAEKVYRAALEQALDPGLAVEAGSRLAAMLAEVGRPTEADKLLAAAKRRPLGGHLASALELVVSEARVAAATRKRDARRRCLEAAARAEARGRSELALEAATALMSLPAASSKWSGDLDLLLNAWREGGRSARSVAAYLAMARRLRSEPRARPAAAALAERYARQAVELAEGLELTGWLPVARSLVGAPSVRSRAGDTEG
jgi:hypothetical protein